MPLNNKMMYLLAGVIVIFSLHVTGGSLRADTSSYGEEEFKIHCAACHSNGGNIINADKTLSLKDRNKHGVNSAKDIIKLMRKPGAGMTTFDKKTVSDKEAKAIADYIIKTFK